MVLLDSQVLLLIVILTNAALSLHLLVCNKLRHLHCLLNLVELLDHLLLWPRLLLQIECPLVAVKRFIIIADGGIEVD